MSNILSRKSFLDNTRANSDVQKEFDIDTVVKEEMHPTKYSDDRCACPNCQNSCYYVCNQQCVVSNHDSIAEDAQENNSIKKSI